MANAVRDRLRAGWQYDLLMACTRDDSVQALPISLRKAQVEKLLRASLDYYRRIGKDAHALWVHELCQMVERSTSVQEVRSALLSQRSATPDSNTGVTDTTYNALADYVAGGK
jgi:hypothetical protein